MLADYKLQYTIILIFGTITVRGEKKKYWIIYSPVGNLTERANETLNLIKEKVIKMKVYYIRVDFLKQALCAV